MNAREEIPITEEVMRYAREHQHYIRGFLLVVLPGYRGRSGLGMKRSAYTGRQSLSAHTQYTIKV